MDKDHRLDAPDNDSLRTIEQVEDHSELSSIYPHAHDEWEGEDLLSREAREEKRDQEQQKISLTIRKWFAVIGILTPLPLVLGTVIVALAAEYLHFESAALLILPVAAIVVFWLYVSYKSIKKVFAIFYDHSLRASPFVVTLLSLLLFSLQGLYVTVVEHYTDSVIYNSIISSLVVLATSVVLSGLLVLIWTSPRLSGAYKFGCIGIIAGIILIVTLLVNVF